MKKYISAIAGIISVLACFVIAGVGAANGVDPATCSYRAVCGAIFVYCAMVIILRIVARVVLSAMIEQMNEQASEEKMAQQQILRK